MRKTDKHLDKLLATQDFDICDMVCGRIFDRYGNDLDVSKYSKEEQVVILVWQAHGIIGNGGFQYLFEHTFKGDPYFVKTVAAFESIQAFECAQGLRGELGIFPQSKPPRNLEQRLRIYDEKTRAKLPRGLRLRIGDKDNATCPIDRFFGQSPEIEKLLAMYIWQNRAAFASRDCK